MANGHKYGDCAPITPVAVASATVIAIGDLIWQDTGASNVPKPAADITWNTNIATTQEDFHDKFMGVALDASRSGDTNQIRVATAGVFEFDCASATFKAGDLVGTAKQTGNAIENQKVVAVATANLAIGRVEKDYASATTKVLVRIDSVVMTGGPRAMA